MNALSHYDLTNAETRVNLRNVFTVGLRDAVDAFLEADADAQVAATALLHATHHNDVTPQLTDNFAEAEACKRFATEMLRAANSRLQQFESDVAAAGRGEL